MALEPSRSNGLAKLPQGHISTSFTVTGSTATKDSDKQHPDEPRVRELEFPATRAEMPSDMSSTSELLAQLPLEGTTELMVILVRAVSMEWWGLRSSTARNTCELK